MAMTNKSKSKASVSKLRGDPFFTVAVSRGGSYLVSTLTAESRSKQLLETVKDFIGQFGPTELPYFLDEVESWLASRGHQVCAAAVAHFREHGTPPPAPASAPRGGRAKARLVPRSTFSTSPADNEQQEPDFEAVA